MNISLQDHEKDQKRATVATLRWKYGLLYKAFASWLASYLLLKNRISDKLARLSSSKSRARPSLCHLALSNSQAAARAAKTRSDSISHSLPALTLLNDNVTEDENPAARGKVETARSNRFDYRAVV